MVFMIRQKLFSILFFAFLFQIANGQELKKVEKLPKTHTIPFKLTEYNNLSVEAILNKTEKVNLMFHTAATAVDMTAEATKKLTSLKFTDKKDGVKSWGGGSNSSRFSVGNSIQIGDLTWEKVTIWEDINSGQHTDGKFGIDLFKGRIIEIDFDQSVIRLHSSLPKKVKQYDKAKLSVDDEMLFIEAGCSINGSSLTNKFLIHSGYAGAILFDDKFASDNKLSEKLEIVGEKILKDSFGNEVKTKQAILPLLKIQNKSLTNVPVGFFEGAIGRRKMSILGGDILKRFNLVIDAKREYIYLKANKIANSAYKKL
jgi:hypothetical protein